MIFVDANILLRYLTPPTDEVMQVHHQQATALLMAIEAGSVSATTNEVVLHETCFVLLSPRIYGKSAGEVIEAMRGILRFPGWSFSSSDLALYLRALDLWEEHPKLEFSDAVIAACCEQDDLELASFDRHFDRLDHLRRWSPPPTKAPS